ncbi:MAG TPA: SDR family oxidoreductase [Abditibacteriaceae bacterium]|nr:SDR family oxidoreductase [Abditibacteriaceae bacterium]
MAVELNGLVCLITGADEGIGHGLVHGFLARGARVAAGLLDASQSTSKVRPALAVQMDVMQPEQVKSAVEKTVAKFGRIDVLINNAGVYPRQFAATMTYAEWRAVLDVNLDGAWHCCEAVIPRFKNQGCGVIINIGSIGLQLGMAELTHYHASKGGIVGLTRGLARDLGQYNVRVNCLHLGAVATEGEIRLFPDQAGILRLVNEKQCLPGRLTPQTIEPVFAFFASAESRDITGQCLTVDRGWTHG